MGFRCRVRVAILVVWMRDVVVGEWARERRLRATLLSLVAMFVTRGGVVEVLLERSLNFVVKLRLDSHVGLQAIPRFLATPGRGGQGRHLSTLLYFTGKHDRAFLEFICR